MPVTAVEIPMHQMLADLTFEVVEIDPQFSMV